MTKTFGFAMIVIGTALWAMGADAAAPATQPATEPSAQPARELSLDLGNKVTMKLVLIPAGKFMMGSAETEKDRSPDEGPQHEVTISKPFYMGATEVTQAQYEAIMGKNPGSFKGEQNPVDCVSWNDAVEFCKALSKKSGKTVTLPTEAQWEYACRAGSKTRFCYGDDNDYTTIGDYAWYSANSESKTHPVGQKKPNDWGLYDMHGNVWEWCSDWFADSYAKVNNIDPTGPASGSDPVMRGSSWIYAPQNCRSAHRSRTAQDSRSYVIGFRVCVDLAPPPSEASPAAAMQPAAKAPAPAAAVQPAAKTPAPEAAVQPAAKAPAPAAAVQPAAEGPAPAASSGNDWPQWRGPGRDSIVPPGGPAIADKWSPEGPVKLWQSEPIKSGAPGSELAGLGSPVVTGGRVYLYVNSGQDVFYCFDAATGKTLWKKTFAAPSGGASGTICVVGDRLYQVGGGGTAYCLNAKTGDEIWKTSGLGGYRCSSFLVAEGKAVVLEDVLVALNADTGQIVWKQEQIRPVKDKGANSPALWKNGGKTYIIQNVMESKVFCVDLADGRVLWKADGGSYSTASIEGDRMVLGVEDNIIAYRLSVSGAEKLWTVKRGGDSASCPIIYKDHVYTAAAGQAHCVELETGKVVWNGPIVWNTASSPVLINDKILTISDGGNDAIGTVTMVSGTPERYELLTKAKVPGPELCTSPAVADGKLYLRLRNAVACYDLVNPGPAAQPEEK